MITTATTTSKTPTKLIIKPKNVVSEKPTIIVLNNENLYLAEDIYNYDRLFFTGIYKNKLRLIIEKKNLLDSDYIWGYKKTGNWIVSDEDYNKSKLLLREAWVVGNVPKMMVIVNTDSYKYQAAPEILELLDEEKFHDKDGNIIEIEVRGERNSNNCYFSVKDVSKGFEMPNLQITLLKEHTQYDSIIHYKYFIDVHKDNVFIPTDRKTPPLFLTYNGILKVLFTSRTGNAEEFQSWATEKLFTIQMGTSEARRELSKSIIGVDTDSVKRVFNANSGTTPVVYLFYIGSAKELLKDDKYTDDDMLCKFGYTNDINARCKQHAKYFKKEFGKDIELLCYSIIEEKYISNAETSIKHFFASNKVDYKNRNNIDNKELIVITKKNMSQYRAHYKMIQNSYIGCFKEMNEQIIKLQTEIAQMKNDAIIVAMENKALLIAMASDNKAALVASENKALLVDMENKLLLLEKEKDKENLENKILFMEQYNTRPRKMVVKK